MRDLVTEVLEALRPGLKPTVVSFCVLFLLVGFSAPFLPHLPVVALLSYGLLGGVAAHFIGRAIARQIDSVSLPLLIGAEALLFVLFHLAVVPAALLHGDWVLQHGYAALFMFAVGGSVCAYHLFNTD